MKDFKTLTISFEDRLIRITLNRPEIHNAFNEVMISELTEAFGDAGGEKGARAIFLTGNGKSFCAGADINWLKKVKDYSFKENLKDSLALAKLFEAIYTHNLPVIGLINGSAIGGGCGLAAVCDIAIASEEAIFSLSELKLGVIPAVISPYIVKRIGEGKTRELFLTGQRINAAQALAIGLVNFTVPAFSLEEKAQEIFSSIKTSGPNAILETKKLFRTIGRINLKKIGVHTARLIAKLRASEEGQEGTAAFLEKRKPGWVD